MSKKKKFNLNNSYFKNRLPGDPSTPYECWKHFKEYGELPYNEEPHDDWIYDCFVEFQKRRGILLEQFFTPQKTANRIAELLDTFSKKEYVHVLDLCAGFGQLSKACSGRGFLVKGVEIDGELCEIYNDFVESDCAHCDVLHLNLSYQQELIVANPPFKKNIIEFMEKLYDMLSDDGIAVLLLPKGFMEKDKPKSLVQILHKFKVLHQEPVEERFSRTGTKAGLFVLTKELENE